MQEVHDHIELYYLFKVVRPATRPNTFIDMLLYLSKISTK